MVFKSYDKSSGVSLRSSKVGIIQVQNDKGGQSHIREILGGNMKTHVAVYEEGLFEGQNFF